MKTTAIWATLFAALLAAPAGAQPVENDIPPVFQSIDENGVDQISGQMSQVMTSISIGPGGPGSLSFNWGNSNATQSQVMGFVEADKPSSGKYTVTIGGSTETFTLTGTLASGTFAQDQGRSSALSWDSGTSRFTYTGPDGTVAIFGQVNPGLMASPPYILSLTYPTGQSLTYHYRLIPATAGIPSYYRVRSVVSNLGYQLHNDYALAPSGTFYRQTGVVLFNRANEACDPAADTCTLTGNWPRLTFTVPSATEVDATDNLSRLYRWINTQQAPQYPYAGTAGTSTLIFPTGRTLTYAINEWGQVTSASDGRGTWQYTRPNPFGGTTLTYYPEQSGPPRQVIFDPATGHILQEVTRQVHSFYTWTNDRISSVSVENGPTTQYTYDARGNVTQTRLVSATPGTPPDIVTSAVYPTTCTNPRTCNQPTSTTDARGFTTDYTYDSATGAVLTMTLPAGANGVRPQTVYGYTAYQAYYLNNAGSIVASGSNVTLPTSISSCITGAPGSCAGTADEARTNIAYGPQTAGTANNLSPVSTTSGNGAGTLAATTAMTYTPDGDVETVDGPLAGSADTARTYYDAARRPTGAISPNPDGGGALLRRASRTTYNDDNQPTVVEIGTATSQSGTSMSTFTSLRQQVTAYDAQGRATSVRLNAGGTTYVLSQESTTLSGLTDCSATRMNPADFASPPAACTQGTGAADRISRIGYNWYPRLPVTVTSEVGTALEAVEATTTYDALNRTATVADGQGNLTTYEYDGLGRQVKTRYPSPATPGQSSTTDYGQLTYDAAGNVTSRRLRDGTSIGYTYDALNRVTFKDVPAGAYWEWDVAYSYDLFGRLLSAVDGYTNAASWTYDALGRNTSETQGSFGTKTMSYDLAGRLTRLTWPDSFYIDYDHLVTGEVSAVRENGATTGIGVLATYAYDDLGRRTSLTRGNGTVTSYSYDNASRLSQLAHDFAGTSSDLTLGFAYNAASQIAGTTRSNDAFAWTAHYATNRNYTANGLNQYTASGSVTSTYDSRGNLASSGSDSYSFTSENRLAVVNATVYLPYWPTGTLAEVWRYGTIAYFDYVGQSLVSEYDGSNRLLRRYVHGAGVDEPLVWYEGTGTSDRRWLHADERGSIVAVSNGSGAVTAVNSYDEHGIPGAANTGRFQYTGQAWLPELGMYYYKARMYSPTLGRFMQTDPIGYGDGMNLYNYVRGDPVNLIDPSGMQETGQDGCPTDARGPCITVTGWRGCDSICDLQHIIQSFNIDIMRGWQTGQTLDPGRGGAGGLESAGNNVTASHCPNGGNTSRMLVTGYDNSFQSTGKNPGDRGYGQAADQTMAGPGTIAAPRSYPFGTRMYVPGYGLGTVHDRGGAIRDAHIDLWFSTTRAAEQWGSQHLNVEVCHGR